MLLWPLVTTLTRYSTLGSESALATVGSSSPQQALLTSQSSA